jgi:hypothetical protein
MADIPSDLRDYTLSLLPLPIEPQTKATKTKKIATDEPEETESKPGKKGSTATKALPSKNSNTSETPFKGITFAISGVLTKPRKQIEALISKLGGKVAGSVTNSVSYLISTAEELESGTTKIETARVKEIPIVGESFLTAAAETGELPDVKNHKLDEEASEEEIDEEDEEEEEDSENPREDWDREGHVPPAEIEYDPEPHGEDESSLDPGIAIYKGPCVFDRVSPDVLGHITSHLRTKHILNLWKTGSKSLQDIMGRLGGVLDLDVNLRRRSDAEWPACISYFLRAKKVSIYAPRYYEHMPCANFDPSTISKSVEYLDIAFGNSLEVVTKSAGPLLNQFPHLRKLTLSGFDHFTGLSAADLAKLEGLTSLDAPISITLNELPNLPRSLVHVYGITINDTDKAERTTTYTTSLPPHLESLGVSCQTFIGPLLYGIKDSACFHSLTSLDILCAVKSTEEPLPLSLDAAAFAILPPTLTALRIKAARSLGDAPAKEIDGSALKQLPPYLTSLILSKYTYVVVKGDHLPDLPAKLRTLRLSMVNMNDDDVAKIPSSVTDLKLVAVHGTSFTPACVDLLPSQLVRLHLHFEGEMSSAQYRALPSTIKHLELYTIDRGFHAKLLPPNLEYLALSFIEDDISNSVVKKMPRSVKTFKVAGDAYWCGELLWPDHLETLEIAAVADEEGLVEDFPRSIKSLNFYTEYLNDLNRLPRNMTSLRSSCNPIHDDQINDFPPYLTVLKLNLSLSDYMWAKLPRTLKEVGLVYYDDIEPETMQAIQAGLPPNCKFSHLMDG